MKKTFPLFVGLCLLLAGAGCDAMFSPGPMKRQNTLTSQGMSGTSYIEIVNPSGFVNTPSTGPLRGDSVEPGQAGPITIGELVGKKVIMVDFLTYSCINCIRTFPYINDWYAKYKDDGLEIVGIHTPEFAFEKKKENVEAAMKKYGITFPIVMDNDYGTWNAYDNHYWPHKYLIDIHGNIVYDHIGEGGYEETERKIRELLEERRQALGEGNAALHEMTPVEESSQARRVGSPEIYFGAHRNERLANGNPFNIGQQAFAAPNEVEPNALYLVGEWEMKPEYAENMKPGARILFRYSAKQVNIVAGAAAPVSVQVLLDGKPIGALAGADVKQGMLTVDEETIYEVVNDPAGYGEHTLELRLDDAGLQAFTFTFG